MNREVRFRGRSIKSGKWLYGYLAEARGKVLQTRYTEKVIFENLEWFNTDNFGFVLNDYAVDPETIGQYTGLKDCNGNDIYEGDIIRSEKYNDIKHTVLYDEQSASFCAICIDANMGTELEIRCHISQEWIDNHPKFIIGNNYDNPELLKTKQI